MRIWPKSICGAGVLLVNGLTVAYIGVSGPRDGWADLADAIPPAYTEHIGRQLITHLSERAA